MLQSAVPFLFLPISPLSLSHSNTQNDVSKVKALEGTLGLGQSFPKSIWTQRWFQYDKLGEADIKARARTIKTSVNKDLFSCWFMSLEGGARHSDWLEAPEHRDKLPPPSSQADSLHVFNSFIIFPSTHHIFPTSTHLNCRLCCLSHLNISV